VRAVTVRQAGEHGFGDAPLTVDFTVALEFTKRPPPKQAAVPVRAWFDHGLETTLNRQLQISL
jgi:hypothetical protein